MIVRINKQVCALGYAVNILRDDGRDLYQAKPITIEWERIGGSHEACMLLPNPSFQISDRDFEMAKNSLFESFSWLGISNPKDASLAEIEATKRHLADMQKLVFTSRIRRESNDD